MANKRLKQPETFYRTPDFILSYPKIMKPQFNKFKKTWEFGLEALFQKGETLADLKKVIDKHAAIVWPDADDREGVDFYTKIRDQKEKRKKDETTGKMYLPEPYVAGNLFMSLATAASDPETLKEGALDAKRPAIVDGKRQPITDASEIYAGCLCQAFVKLYAYEMGSNKGITLFLMGVQKREDRSPLSGGRKNADDMFVPVEGADDADAMFA